MTPPELVTWALLGGVFLVAAALATVVVALIVQMRARPAAVHSATATAEQAKLAAEQQARAAQGQAKVSWQWYEAAVAEAGNLVDRLRALTDIEAKGHTDVAVPGLLHREFATLPLQKHLQAAEQQLREAVRTTRTRIGASARAGVRGTSDEVQMFLTRLQMKIDEALDDFPAHSAFHQSLIGIDHEATRALHSVQRLRILAGSWPGIQRADSTFREIVESARGRIGPYDRVRYTYLPQAGEAWVEGRVVEPIVVVLAELLANATSYSSDPVDVHVNEVRAGYRIVVEDSGYGMNAFQLEEAERLLSHRTELDAASLEDERKLGFPVIGRLACDYDIRVDVSAPSTSGGVKAVCLIPHSLITAAPSTHEPAEHAALERNDEPVHDQELAVVAPPSTNGRATTPLGLPKRQRRPDAAPPMPGPATQEAVTDTLTPEAASDGMARMRDAFRRGYDTIDNDTQGHSQP
ncbi:ATP-binding protein [Nonomuraea sp. NPDC026600]|uniref:ATP-binding protein n=1 Tax=Nonomuraea sp. NPDC026600 TaxID=3155363 RepID=UPI0033DFBAA8